MGSCCQCGVSMNSLKGVELVLGRLGGKWKQAGAEILHLFPIKIQICFECCRILKGKLRKISKHLLAFVSQ